MKNNLILLFSIMNILSLNNCFGNNRYEEIDKVNKEVDYSILILDNKSYTKNNIKYDFTSMAYSEIGNNSYNNNDYTLIKKDNNIIYYQLSYNQYNKGKNKDEFGYSINNYYFDIALFKVDIFKNSCELLYDCKDVYPIGKYGYTAYQIFHYLDDNTFSLQYNGMLKTIDINTQNELCSFDIYNKEDYRNADYCPFNYVGNNFYYKENDILNYYIYDNGIYKYKKYNINQKTFYIDQYNEYLYTYNYESGYVYYDCYNLNNDQKMDDTFLKNLIEKIDKERWNEYINIDDTLSIKIDDTLYTFDYYVDKLQVLKNDDEYLLIDEDYMLLNSKPFNDLYNLYPNARNYEFNKIFIKDNKILITFQGEYSMFGSTAEYVYELDLKNNKIYYVGYNKGNSRIQDIFIIE